MLKTYKCVAVTHKDLTSSHHNLAYPCVKIRLIGEGGWDDKFSAIAYHRRYRAEPWTLDLPQVF